MRLSDLQLKEIVDTSNGRRIGNIIDIIININGNISKLVVEDKTNKRIFSSNKDDLSIDWGQIIKIGDDIILVDLSKN